MDRLLLPLIGTLALLMAGAGFMFTWDRHPAWGVHVPVLWWHVGFDLPPSLAGQRDAALVLAARGKADLAQLSASLDRQNAAAVADKAEGDRMAAAVAKGRQATAAEAARADRNAAALGRVKVAGADQCAQLLSADAQVKELSR